MNILSLDLSTKSKEKIINIEQLNTYKNYFVVYLLIFPNKKIYCGYSSNIRKRWRNEKGYKDQQFVYRAIQKYGWDNIEKYIYKSFDKKEEALREEYNIIKQYNLTNPENGYNLVDGGGDPPHGLSYITEEGYKKMVLNGKRLANEVWNNPEKATYTIQRMREETHKKRMLLSKDELKEKYGKCHLGKIPSNAKTILQIDLKTKKVLNEYPSARQAAIALGLDPTAGSNIQRTARGIGKSAYGYFWRWKDNELT